MSAPRDWEALQERFVRGERLSAEEEQERRRYAGTDPLAARELEVFDALAGHVAHADAEDARAREELAERALRAVRGLRLVAPPSTPRAKSARGRRGFAWIALAAGASMAAALAFVAGREKPKAALPSPVGSVEARAAVKPSRAELVFGSGELEIDGHPSRAGAGLLAQGARIRTRAGRACLTIDPSIDVCLDRESEVELTSLVESKLAVRLLAGSAAAALTTRAAGQTFSILMGDASATARGTAFAVSYDAQQKTKRVTVVEGKVEVRATNQTELVEPHTSLSWVEEFGDKSLLGRSEEAGLWALLAPRELWQGVGLGVLSVPPAASGTRILVDELGPFELPLSVFVRAKRHQVVFLPTSGGEASLRANVEAGHETVVSSADPKAPVTARAAEHEAKSAEQLLAEARQKLRGNDARGAALLYERLVSRYPQSSEATTVQVTLGKLQLSLGAPARALASFDRYLASGGPLAPEALSGKIRALRALGKTDAERAAIVAYLSRYPNGFDADSLKARAEALGAP